MLTESVDEFVAALAPGDVLLFDKLRAVGALIQFADNAPASHCAIVVDDTCAVDATLPDANRRRTIMRSPVKTLIDHDYTHGIMALRPRGLTDAQLERILEVVEVFLARQAEYKVMEMLALAPSSLLRSYQADEFPFSERVWNKITRGLEAAAFALDWVRTPGTRFLTCSEFVYRVLGEAGISVTVLNPLPSSTRRVANTLRSAGPETPWESDLAITAQELESRLTADSETAVRGEGIRPPTMPGQADPDLVTPGDFYRSPSFDVTARYAPAHRYLGNGKA